MSNIERGDFTPEQESEETEIPTPKYNTGDIIDFDGKKVRVKGFTAPEGQPGRAFMVEDLTEDELRDYKQREEVITGKVKGQIEANPNSLVDIEQAKKYWGRIYDETNKGDRMEMQLNEIYAQKYEENARFSRDQILKLEQQLDDAGTEAEKQAIFAKIAEWRDNIQLAEEEAKHRRNYEWRYEKNEGK